MSIEKLSQLENQFNKKVDSLYNQYSVLEPSFIHSILKNEYEFIIELKGWLEIMSLYKEMELLFGKENLNKELKKFSIEHDCKNCEQKEKCDDYKELVKRGLLD